MRYKCSILPAASTTLLCACSLLAQKQKKKKSPVDVKVSFVLKLLPCSLYYILDQPLRSHSLHFCFLANRCYFRTNRKRQNKLLIINFPTANSQSSVSTPFVLGGEKKNYSGMGSHGSTRLRDRPTNVVRNSCALAFANVRLSESDFRFDKRVFAFLAGCF